MRLGCTDDTGFTIFIIQSNQSKQSRDCIDVDSSKKSVADIAVSSVLTATKVTTPPNENWSLSFSSIITVVFTFIVAVKSVLLESFSVSHDELRSTIPNHNIYSSSASFSRRGVYSVIISLMALSLFFCQVSHVQALHVRRWFHPSETMDGSAVHQQMVIQNNQKMQDKKRVENKMKEILPKSILHPTLSIEALKDNISQEQFPNRLKSDHSLLSPYMMDDKKYRELQIATPARCSCFECTDEVLYGTYADSYTCGARMNWLKSPDGGSYSENTACKIVVNEFPTICGPKCDPEGCAKPYNLNIYNFGFKPENLNVYNFGVNVRGLVTSTNICSSNSFINRFHLGTMSSSCSDETEVFSENTGNVTCDYGFSGIDVDMNGCGLDQFCAVRFRCFNTDGSPFQTGWFGGSGFTPSVTMTVNCVCKRTPIAGLSIYRTNDSVVGMSGFCAIPKSENSVVVYTASNYEGCGYSFAAGDYDSSTLFSYGLYNSIISVNVPSGYMIYLYADPGYTGNRTVAVTDIPNLNALTTESANPGISKTFLDVASFKVTKLTSKPTTSFARSIVTAVLDGYKCISSGNKTAGEYIFIDDCNGWNNDANQIFIIGNDDTLKVLGTNNCITANSLPIDNPVFLATCSNDDSQKWLYDDLNFLRLKATPACCLDLPAAKTATGTPVVTNWCWSADVDIKQRWYFNCPKTNSIDTVTVDTNTAYGDCSEIINDSNIRSAAYLWVTNSSMALSKYGHISMWDTSRVTDMDKVFYLLNNFNEDLSTWNTSRVTNMSQMFWRAYSFNGDVSKWDTGKVQEMKAMFSESVAFNHDLSLWNTSEVTSMYAMFFKATAFNQTLCWNVHKVTDFKDMFDGSYGLFSLTPYPSCKSTLADGSHVIYGRYINLTRVTMSPVISAYPDYFNLPYMINILGLDVYDRNGVFISNQSTPFINDVWVGDLQGFGPQYLIDGVHQLWDGYYRISATNNIPNAYMQLDFGRDVSISKIVLWNDNRDFCCNNRIIGTKLSVINNSGAVVFKQNITSDQLVNIFDFGFQAPTTFRTTSGPIRNILGKCINVPGRFYQVGVQLTMSQCYGRMNEQWSRPTSTDLRLQSQANLCMSTSGNATVGSAVVLATCNATAAPQKWIFDGRSLHPTNNYRLCLTFDDQFSNNDPLLIISTCDSSSASAWVEYSMALISEKSTGNADLVCPVGSKVNRISGRYGSWVHQIIMTCDDANRTVLGPVGRGTGNSLLENYSTCTDGYTAMRVLSGDYVGQISALCSGSSSFTDPIGLALNGTGRMNRSVVLQGKQRIIGMQVDGNDYVKSIAVLYSTVSAWPITVNPTAQPTANPSTRHTSKPTMTKGPSTKPSTKPSQFPTVWSGSWKTFQSSLYGVSKLLTNQVNLTESHHSCPMGSRVVSIEGSGTDWVHHLHATCDDKSKTTLGPWGPALAAKASFHCDNGFKGWSITYGEYIGRISFTCKNSLDSFLPSIGTGFFMDLVSTNRTLLTENQNIVGFRVYNDSKSIRAMIIEYAELNKKGRCFNSIGEPTGKCPALRDYLAILWGLVTMIGIAALIAPIIANKVRKRRKRLFKRRDNILPLK